MFRSQAKISLRRLATTTLSKSLLRSAKTVPVRNSTFSVENFSKQLTNAVGAMTVLSFVMLGWPPAVVTVAKFVASTPVDTTAAVHIVNGKAEVDIPQTYAKFSSGGDDDE